MSDGVPPWRSFSSKGPSEATPPSDSADDHTEADPPVAATASAHTEAASDRFGLRSLAPMRTSLSLAGLIVVGSVSAGVALGATIVTLVDGAAATGSPDAGGSPFTASLASMRRSDHAPLGASGIASNVRSPTELVVHVAGAVVEPGLHHLGEGDRVGDAIDAAGGFAPRADLIAASRTLNLAQPLTDGAKVLVPTLGSAAAPERAADSRIDLNRADQAALESLPGVGPVTATRIMEARAQKRFGKAQELRGRGIVGESVYGRLKDLVRAGP